MESSKEETKTLLVSEENRTDATQEDNDLKKIKELQTLFKKLSMNEKLMLNLNTLKETKNFAQIKSIDLIKFLRGTQYSTKVEQFFEFELVFKKLEQGFKKLQCSHHDCEFQAVMAFKCKDGEPTIQYCNYHFNHSNFSTGSPKNFEFELRLHKLLFNEIEWQLVYIQDRIDFIKSDKNQKNMSLYAKIENDVQSNLKNIINILKTMTERIYQIDETKKMKANNKASIINFTDFSFVRKDLAKWRKSILTILSFISEPTSMNQASSLIQVMEDFKNWINLEEERKYIPDSSVPHDIYNSDYQMVNFPSQSLQSIKNFEQKISTVYEYIETFQKVDRSLHILLLIFMIVHILNLKCN